MTFYFNARDHEYQLSEQQLTQQTVGENLMFFQDNTRSKFTISKNLTLLFHKFNQPKVQR